MDDETYTKVYLPKYREAIKALARKLARRDQELFEDLRQEGMIALWRLDPTKAKDNEDAWVRQALYNTMVTFLRKERPARFESLETRLERGDQLVAGDDGETRLLPALRRDGRREALPGAYGEREEDDQ